jgi:voltage-gated potassium channel
MGIPCIVFFPSHEFPIFGVYFLIMKRLLPGSIPIWNAVLLFSVVFATFILPVLPVHLQKDVFRSVYSVIYLTAVFSLERRAKAIFVLFVVTLVLEWISGLFDLPLLQMIARGTNILFFLVVVASLIYQIAVAKEVNTQVILGSIIGYLLLGLIYSIFISYIMHHDPGAYSAQVGTDPTADQSVDASIPMYYGFVTLATLGYGDIVPLKPYTRSFATFITVSGQFYIAIIVALLVGKFLSRKTSSQF